MAIDRETIVSLHKKGESNSTIAKELQIRRDNGLESGQEVQGDRPDIQSTGQTKRKVTNTREKLKTNPFVRLPNWPQTLDSARFRCAASLRRTSRPSPTRCRSDMSSHRSMNEWRSKNVATFWTSWKIACCPIWCSLTRRNLTLSTASTIKTTVFGVGMHPWNAGEWVNARIQPLLGVGRPSQPLEGLPSFSCPQKWN